MFKVEKNVPAPPASRNRKVKYPFYNMEVGDSFQAPKHDRNSIATCAAAYSRRLNPRPKFTVRIVDDQTVRVWRIE